jgi:hypothetical protein
MTITPGFAVFIIILQPSRGGVHMLDSGVVVLLPEFPYRMLPMNSFFESSEICGG